MHQILWLLYIAIIWYKKSTSLLKPHNKALTRIYSRSFFTQFTQRCIEKVQQTLIDFISNTTEDIKKRFSQINAKFIADFGKMLFINLLIFDKDNK